MGKYLEIKWQGRPGQGVVSAATVLAEVFAREGKYVQAFPEFIAQKRRPSILAFNRISESPIKTHAEVNNADFVVLLDVRLLLNTDVKKSAGENAAYIINTTYSPDFIKEKLNLLDNNKIYTLDADTIANEELGHAIPNIPLMTIVLNSVNLIHMENYRKRLKETLSLKLNPELVEGNIATIERALKEVKQL
jgi:2-oxoacid:acceptor oxidoreductase gamma subunit (pyruvate/2-ketoisovalerate family)